MDLDQIRSHLHDCLQASNLQTELTIDRTTFNDTRISQLIDTYYGGTSLVIDQASIQPPQDGATAVVVSGKAPFLNIPELPVSATFQQAQDSLNVTLRYQLPATWKFSQSFPAMPLNLKPQAPGGLSLSATASPNSAPPGTATAVVTNPTDTEVAEEEVAILDLLSYTEPYFIVTTTPFLDEEYQVQVDAGLSFVSHLRLQGILGGIEKTLNVAEPITLAGPIILSALPAVSDPSSLAWPPLRNSQPRPGINLRADAHVDLALGQVKLKDAYVRFYSPLSSDNLFFLPGIFFGGDLQIGEQITLDVVAEKVLFEDNSLILAGTFQGVELPSLSHLAELVGADDLAAHLTVPSPVPSFLSPEHALSIRGVSLSLNCDPFSVDAVGIWLGLDGPPWQVIDQVFEVDDLMIRFWVNTPFSLTRSLQATVIGKMKVEGVPLLVSASAPDFTITGRTLDPAEIPLQTLLARHVPDISFASDLAVDTFLVSVQPGHSYHLQTELADQPQALTIQLGPETLTVSNIQILLDYTQGSGFSGAFNAVLALAGVQLQVTYQSPGSLSLRGRLPSVSLKQVVTHLCGTSQAWPSSFDLTLSESTVLIEEQPSGFVFMLGTQVETYGCLALQISCQNEVWGFALGIDLDKQWKLSTISSDLKIFDDSFQFDKALLVFSSIQSPTFTFPDMAAFNNPTLTSSRVVMPASVPGIAQGFNLYTQVAFESHKALQIFKRALQINQTTLDVVLQVGETLSDVTLSARIQGQLNSATTWNGSLRVIDQGGSLVFSLLGNATLTVHNQPLSLGGEIDVTETGAYGSLSMRGQWIDAFDVHGLALSDVALEVGADEEGIPTIGLAATLDYQGHQGSVAILLDSVEPGKSMLAGCLSDLALADVVRGFLAGSAVSLPPELNRVVNEIQLVGVPLLSLPANLATDLDAGRLPQALVQAFASQGRTTLPVDPKQVLLVMRQQGTCWSLTDETTLRHYEITRNGDQLQVSLPVQFSIVPQMTRIGQLVFPQGFRLVAAGKVTSLDASINIDVSQQNGLVLDGTLDFPDLSPLFSLSGPQGKGQPQISLATYNAPGSPYNGPHCVIRGSVTMLGFSRDLDLQVTRDGLMLQVGARIFNAFQASVSAVCPFEHFSQADFSVTATMDNDLFTFLKTRGTAAIQTVATQAHTALASAQGKVNDAQKQVDTLNAKIASITAQIQAERQKAQQALSDAQAKVNGIQQTIDGQQKNIDSLQSDIDSLTSEIKHNPVKAVVDGPIIVEKGSEIAGLKTAQESERAALVAANGVLTTCKQAVQTTPIEADPRLASLYTARTAATTTLQAYNDVLGKAQQASGHMASAADWITQHGSDQLLIVNHASFSGRLGQVSGGRVSMQMDLSVMGKPYHLVQDFNFHDLENTASTFAEKVKELI